LSPLDLSLPFPFDNLSHSFGNHTIVHSRQNSNWCKNNR
jgi:hypothetical protein